MPHPGQVLFVEDDPRVAKVVRKLFARWAPELEVEGAASLTQEIDGAPDVVLLDPGLKESQWADSMHIARNRWPSAPIIVLTAEAINGEADVLRMAGASNVFEKSRVLTDSSFAVLLKAIQRSMGQRGRLTTETEIVLDRAVQKVQTSPLMKKVVGWALGAVVGLGGGGAAVVKYTMPAEQGTPSAVSTSEPAWHRDTVERQIEAFESKTHATEVVGQLRSDISRVDATVQRLEERSISMMRALDRISGYLDAARRRDKAIDEEDRSPRRPIR